MLLLIIANIIKIRKKKDCIEFKHKNKINTIKIHIKKLIHKNNKINIK